ncbi:MAG: hypothetical protein Q6373_019640 [Candidatus Sigynarchaeota archaeon]
MVRGSPEIFRKVKAWAVLSAVLLSGIVMPGIPSISTLANCPSSKMGGTPADSYADIGRPSFLVPGNYLEYSVNYGLIPGAPEETTTNLTANLRYTFNSISGQNYSINEQTTNLHVYYGFTLPGPVIGFYNTSVANATLLAEQYRGYSAGPIKASVSNSTNFATNYTFTTTLDMYTSNGTFRGASGNGTNQVVVDSMLTIGSPARGLYYGYYRTILSYYKSLSTLYRSPKALFTPIPGFTIDGTASIATYMGTRSAVKIVRNVINGSIYKWQDNLYIDVYTGALIKAVMYVDNKINNTVPIFFHQLEFNLVDTNIDFGTPTPSPRNTFSDGMYDVTRYLANSALNDTNRSLFHHAAIGGAATPSNSTKLASDTFKIMLGYNSALGTPLATLFSEVNASRLRDVQKGGFYRSMNAAGTVVDGVKTVTDAAWAIIGSTTLGSSASRFQEEMFNYMISYHYGSGNYSGYRFYAFARYNATSDTEFYAYDNLIAYLALNWLANYHGSDTVKAQARDKAYRVISLFSMPGSFPGFLHNSLFITSIGKNGLPVGTQKSVLDAVLAIHALSTYYMYNQTTQAKIYVDRAKAAFNRLLDRAWNATNKGFIHAMNFNMDPIDSNQFLEDNAWAMTASLSLLVAANHAYSPVKNITYYDVACDAWAAVKKVLYDSQNKTFKAASNNKASLAGDLGLLLYALSGMYTTSRSTTLTVSTNATGNTNTFVYEKKMPVKAKATWKLNMTSSLPNPITTVIPLNYSDVYFRIRYSNKTVYDEIFTVTDNLGDAYFTFPLPNPPEFTDMDPAKKSQTAHLIGVVANRTGFEATEAFKEFYITSSITVWTDPKNPSARFDFSGSKFTAYFMNRTSPESVPAIYPGEKFTVKINMSNSISTAQNLTITFKGNIIETASLNVTVNGSAVNSTYTLELTAKGQIPTEMQAINFSISKNGSAVLSGEIPVYVNIPIVLTNVIYPAYMVDTSNYSLTFNVKNMNKNRNESVKLVFSSVNIELASGNATRIIENIVPDQEIPVAIIFRLKPDHAKLNQYQFSIILSWANVSLGTLQYLVPFRAPIEVISLSGPAKPVQGGPLLFAFSFRNNLASSASVRITITRVLATGAASVVLNASYTLATGSNNFIASCKDPLENPWDIGTREYQIAVQYGDKVIGKETVASNVQMSVENVIFGYVLVFGAFGILFILILNKKRQLESARR